MENLTDSKLLSSAEYQIRMKSFREVNAGQKTVEEAIGHIQVKIDDLRAAGLRKYMRCGLTIREAASERDAEIKAHNEEIAVLAKHPPHMLAIDALGLRD